METLLSDFRWSEQGAGEASVKRAQAEFGRLPDDYLDVLRAHDGGEGWVGEGAYLRLWPIPELEGRNQTLQAKQLVPGVVLIGTDGADDLYAIEPASGAYLIFPAVGLSASAGKKVAESWEGFLKALSTS